MAYYFDLQSMILFEDEDEMLHLAPATTVLEVDGQTRPQTNYYISN